MLTLIFRSTSHSYTLTEVYFTGNNSVDGLLVTANFIESEIENCCQSEEDFHKTIIGRKSYQIIQNIPILVIM